MRNSVLVLLVLTLFSTVDPILIWAAPTPTSSAHSMTGTLELLAVDSKNAKHSSSFLIRLVNSTRVQLRFKDPPALGLIGKTVTVQGNFASDGSFDVSSISATTAPSMLSSVTGPQSTIVILLKYSDITGEPHPPSYFESTILSSSGASMNTYYQENSFSQMSVSGAVAGWLTLPHNYNYYSGGSSGGSTTQAQQILTDGIGVADPYVNFQLYGRIILILNSDLGCSCAYAFVGPVSAISTGDGVITASVGYIPDDGWGATLGQGFGVIAHEYGHEIGLPHSGIDYDSPWDIMSGGDYGPVQTIAPFKYQLGWMPSNGIVQLAAGQTFSGSIAPLETTSSGYQSIFVQISSSYYYSIEYRRKVGFDSLLPSEGIVIHLVGPVTADPTSNAVVQYTSSISQAWQQGQTFSGSGISIVIGSCASTCQIDIGSATSLTITNPTAGSSWTIGSTQTITWSTTGPVNSVDLWYNAGGGWVNIIFGAPNTGSYFWVVPNSPSTLVRVGIDAKSSSNAIVATGYSGYFTIAGGSASVTVTSPAGGEAWSAGSSHAITWTTTGSVAKVDILYSTGSSWTNIILGAGNIGSYSWVVPNKPSTTARVRIDAKSSSGSVLATAYSGYFTITGPSPPVVKVTSPVGGESWAAGSSHSVTWTTTGSIVKVDIWYNAGGGWVNIVFGAANTGSYTWTVPNTPSTSVRVGIDGKSSSGSILATGYGGYFTITSPSPPSITVTSPVGGESWAAGSTHPITWSSTGVTGGTVDVWYNAGGGWTNIKFGAANTGSYSWTIPNIASTTVRVGIDLKSSGAIVATGYGGIFTITGGAAPPSLTITSPAGGESWASGSTHTITWTSTGGGVYVDIYYRHDGILTLIVRNAPNSGSYSWTIPNTPSSNVYIGMDLKDGTGKIIATVYTTTPFTTT